jgi:hypothetical protein
MGKTVRNERHDKWTDERRPEWQQDRGYRYGNQRKQIAELKVRERRADRRTSKQDQDWLEDDQ